MYHRYGAGRLGMSNCMNILHQRLWREVKLCSTAPISINILLGLTKFRCCRRVNIYVGGPRGAFRALAVVRQTERWYPG